MAKLTKKQKRFVDEYCIDLNATQAAIRAGYSSSTAKEIGCENLTKPNIKTAIDAALEKIHTANVATAQEVEEYLTRVMRGTSTAEIVVVEGVGDGCSVARVMSKAPDEKERLRAAELLAKRYGLIDNRLKIDAIPVIIRGEAEIPD